MTAARPKLIIEVLSPNSRDTDVFNKLDEYKGRGEYGLRRLDRTERGVALRMVQRRNDGWAEKRVEGLNATIEMPKLRISLRMGAIFEGVRSAMLRQR